MRGTHFIQEEKFAERGDQIHYQVIVRQVLRVQIHSLDVVR